MDKYLIWLHSVKGYSILTCNVYYKYAKLLNESNMDYNIALSKFPNISNNTKRVILSAIKKFYYYKQDKRYTEIVLPKKNKIVCDYLSIDEYQKILNYVLNKKRVNWLKILMIRLLFETGIRSSELLSINSLDIKDNKIIIKGKNNKERLVYLSPSLTKILNNVISKTNGSTKIFHFGYKSLYKKIKLLGNKVLNKNLTPHMFRRGFATHCISNNIGIYELSLMMGHDNINTTKLYLRNDDKISVMQTLFN
ncbi:tyrosine-type recombinase/integrase [Malacoplasma muris]|uniref:tyrosine-type recombinase/integrase n=1 Tax=Malacoplasma muris TaxID=2119 RepID=UPI00398E94C5